jgi:hypothetical protein
LKSLGEALNRRFELSRFNLSCSVIGHGHHKAHIVRDSRCRHGLTVLLTVWVLPWKKKEIVSATIHVYFFFSLKKSNSVFSSLSSDADTWKKGTSNMEDCTTGSPTVYLIFR